jgi:hypothetical protein
MYLRTMLFCSLKNLFLWVACRCPRAVKPNFPAFEFIHIRDIRTSLQRLSFKSNEIILYERFRQLGCQLLEPHNSQICCLINSSSSYNNVSKWLSSISLTSELMNPHRGINDNNKKDRTEAIAAIPMVGAIVTAALLLSGLALIGSYQQPVIAQQQNMTGGNATMAGGGNATNATMAGGGNATNATMAGGGNATNATMAGGGNATNMTTGGTEGGGGTTGGTEGGGGPGGGGGGPGAGGPEGGGPEGGGGGGPLEGIFGGGQ